MIEAIHNLLIESKAQHMQLIIRAEENGSVSVVANTVLKPISANEPKDMTKLRAALVTPLTMRGSKGEVDIEFSEALTAFANAFNGGSKVINDSQSAAASIEKATKKAISKTVTSNDKKVSDSAENTGGSNEPNTDTPSLDALTSGEADSL